MARIENTKMTVSLDNDSKRLIRTLTKAIDRLAKTQEPTRGYERIKRLSEPVMDVAEGGYDRGEEVSDEDESRRKRPEMFPSSTTVSLNPEAIQSIAAATGKYAALG